MVNYVRKLSNFRLQHEYKIAFTYSHLDEFPENFIDVSEEQGERFHQGIKDMERRFYGRWSVTCVIVTMMVDFCWMLKYETYNVHKRSFYSKRQRYS